MKDAIHELGCKGGALPPLSPIFPRMNRVRGLPVWLSLSVAMIAFAGCRCPAPPPSLPAKSDKPPAGVQEQITKLEDELAYKSDLLWHYRKIFAGALSPEIRQRIQAVRESARPEATSGRGPASRLQALQAELEAVEAELEIYDFLLRFDPRPASGDPGHGEPSQPKRDLGARPYQ